MARTSGGRNSGHNVASPRGQRHTANLPKTRLLSCLQGHAHMTTPRPTKAEFYVQGWPLHCFGAQAATAQEDAGVLEALLEVARGHAGDFWCLMEVGIGCSGGC